MNIKSALLAGIIMLIISFSVVSFLPTFLSVPVFAQGSAPYVVVSPPSATIGYAQSVDFTVSWGGFNSTPQIYIESGRVNGLSIQLVNNVITVTNNGANPGTYIIKVGASTVNQSATTSFSVNVPVPSFTLSASPSSVIAIENSTNRYDYGISRFTITAQSNDPEQLITLSTNASWIVFPFGNTLQPGQGIIAETFKPPLGNFTVVITGKNNGGYTATTNVSVEVVYGVFATNNGSSIWPSLTAFEQAIAGALTFSMSPIGTIIANGLGSVVAGIAKTLGGPNGIYNLLIELPAPNNPDGTTYALWNEAIMPLYWKVTDVVLVFFVFALFIAGLEWAFESFKILREGTAMSMLIGSAFTLILLFLFPYLYGFVAEIFNLITYPANNMLLPNGAIYQVIKGTISATPSTGLLTIPSIILSVIIFVLDLIVLLMVGIMGILRIFFIAALVVMMPLLLVLRLIPFTKHVAEELISMLIGLMVSSLFVAIFFAFAYAVLQAQPQSYFSQFGALATLIAGAMMPTVMAPRLGRVFETTAMMATGAVMTGAMVGTMAAGGTVYGAGMGAKIVAQGGAQALAARTGLSNTAAALHIMGQNITAHGLRGAGMGLQSATHMPMGAHMPLRGTGSALTAFGSKIAMNPQEMQHYTAGTHAEAILTHHVTNNLQPVPTGINYHESLENMPDRALIEGMNKNYGTNLGLEHAYELRKFLHSLDNERLGHVLTNPKKYSPDEIKTAHNDLITNRLQLQEKLKQQGKELYTPDWVVSARRRYFRKQY